jgi:hypothetical protein
MARPEGKAERAPARGDFRARPARFDDPNAIDRLDLDEPNEDRELITGVVADVLLTVCFRARSPQTHHLGPEGNEP